MRIADVMQTNAHYVFSGQTVENAARRMHTHGLALLPVCRPEGAVIGLVTPHEIVKAVAQSRAAELCTVDEIMAADFPTCAGEDNVDEVYARLLTSGLDAILVTSGRTLAGVVDRAHLASAALAVPFGAPAGALPPKLPAKAATAKAAGGGGPERLRRSA